MDKTKIANRLCRLRTESGLTQRQAAEKLGISPAPLSAYELGKKLPPLETLAAMAELYKVSIEDIVQGNNSRIKERNTADLAKNIAELFLSGKVTSIQTKDENFGKIIKNIFAISTTETLDKSQKIEILESYIEKL